MESKINDELLFKDWIAQEEWKDPDWIILSKFTRGDNAFWTHSVLLFLDRLGDIKESVPTEIRPIIREKILEKLFEDNYLDNDLHGNFGIPNIGMNDELFFNDETVDDRELRFRPIIYTYSYSENLPERTDPLQIYLSPDIVTLYKLKKHKNVFTRIDQMGNEVEVVKIELNESNNTLMKIRTDYIRDFITSANMALVRIHSHLRYRNGEVKIEKKEHEIKDKYHYYKIRYLDRNLVHNRTGQKASHLRGIDIILPYDNPINENRILGLKPELDIEFIIGRNVNGTNKVMNPKEANHSDFTFLQSVCFKKTIMLKFYQRTELYSVTEGSHIVGPGFHLPYNNTSEDSIMIYLGDLTYLPLEELQYFKSYNINCPKISMTEDRYRRDFLAEFTSPQDFEYHLKTKIRDLNNLFKEIFGLNLFRLEKNEVLNYLNQIHLPVTIDRKEFKDIIIATTKVLIESIPTSELRKLLKNPEKWKQSGSLKILEELLSQLFPEWSNPIEFLYYLSDFRNKYAAHLSGKIYQKFLAKNNLTSKNTKEISNWLFYGLMEFINNFITNLKSYEKK